MEFEHKGTVYCFTEPTVRQMEILSEMLHESRESLLKKVLNEAGSPQDLITFSVKISDILQDIRRKGKLTEFAALCVVKKDSLFDEREFRQRIQEFASLSYEKAEAVFSHFFTGGTLQKILMPGFLTAQAKAGTAGNSRGHKKAM